MISQSVVCIYIHVPCWAVVIDSLSLYIVQEHSRYPSTQDDYSSYRWFKSAAYRHGVIGLLTSIVWTLIDRLDDVYITDIVYLSDVLVVIVYMPYCNCWDYLLLHEDWGECSEDWAGACRWGGGGGGGGICNRNFFFSLINVPGVLKRKTKIYLGGGGFWGVWGASRPHPGVARGQKMIHLFLWPWHVTS